MHFGAHEQLILVGLLLALAALLVAAPVLRIPYPIFLVLGGLALGFVPGMPSLQLPPDIVLIAVLPPLLYSAAFFTSLRDLRANVRPIGVLSVGLVIATMTVVAVIAHQWVDRMSWSAAFVLGAVVSPTDPIAATAVMHRFGVPRRIVAIVEGEALVNDGTALVLYRVAVTAAVTGTFSFWDASWRFAWSVAGGVAIGLVVGFLVAAVRRRLDNPPVEVTIALMTGYFAFLPANAVQASGVLAVVTAGIYLGWHTPELTSVQTRLQGAALWEILTFVINALLFALVGLQLSGILDRLTGISAGKLIWWGLLVTGAVVVTRLILVPVFTFLPGLFRHASDSVPPLSQAIVISWSGMRGAVSLAAALAIPLLTDAGTRFPERDLIIFLTFCVLLGTLVGQGLTLPLLIRGLGIEPDHLDEKETAKARIKAADAALARLEELTGEDWVRDDTAERLRGLYGFRRNRFASRFDREDDGAIEEQSLSYQRLRRELLDAERAAIVNLRREGVINDEVERRLHRDLDLEDARLEV
ncbi:MAG: monovalent cation/hydrogen antiporter [Gaiellaceae bacterium]|nr:monovalent cation/hydrogen antiporter [Gaiellaceae bacterium]